jgi:hypothetical protein
MLEGEATKLSKKLIGLRYNMDNRKVVVIEVEEGLDSVKFKLNELTSQVKLLKE